MLKFNILSIYFSPGVFLPKLNFLYLYPFCWRFTANKWLYCCRTIHITPRCVSFFPSRSSRFSSPSICSPLLNPFLLYLSSVVLLLPVVFACCVCTAGWRWMMPFATSSWTSPVFHPGWQGRTTSCRRSSTKLSLPKKSITKAKVQWKVHPHTCTHAPPPTAKCTFYWFCHFLAKTGILNKN